MSFFELSLLAGLAFGGLAAAQLWKAWAPAHSRRWRFSIFFARVFSTPAQREAGDTVPAQPCQDSVSALREPALRRLAPIWICVNSIIGLWLGPNLSFLLTERTHGGQFLHGVFADTPESLGWMLLGYSVVFGTGVTAWGLILPRLSVVRALRISLRAMFAVCTGLFVLNHCAPAPCADTNS